MRIPYLYFMDTNHITELDFSGCLDIVYHSGQVVSVAYKRCLSNRSVFVLGNFPLVKNDAHVFFIKGDLETMDIIQKLNQLLSISLCTIVGCGPSGDALLRMTAAAATAAAVAPWTISMIINPEYSGYMGLDLSKIKERNLSGTHLFYILQNRKDVKHYDKFFNGPMKGLFVNNVIQGWSYQIPSKSFYNDSLINQHEVALSSADLLSFIDYMSFNKKDSEALALYNIYREY